MIKINKNFLELQDNYLFSNINKKVESYLGKNPNANIIKLGIGDVTRPIPSSIVEKMKKAAEEMQYEDSFRGYGPEQGYEFLRKKILESEYKDLDIDLDEIFISDGAKCDTGNIIELFDKDIKVGIPNPVYPVYLDSNIIYGTSGKYIVEKNEYENIIYINFTEENNFEPLPEELEQIPDLIYICSPNNPTGTVMKKDNLEKWVKFAKKNNSIILFDAAYEAFIKEEDIPHSIYEVSGAKEVAIEFKSFSKTAGFTGLRCAYTIVPKNIRIMNDGKEVSLNKLWNRRQSTKFNGVSYITQRAAESVYTEEGKKEIKDNITYYMENAKIIKNGLEEIGIKTFGGVNSPYIWMKTPNGIESWRFFDVLLEEYNIVGTPGVGFGTNGEGFFRLTAFGNKFKTIEAMERLMSKKEIIFDLI